jgi:hypothetical protein
VVVSFAFRVAMVCSVDYILVGGGRCRVLQSHMKEVRIYRKFQKPRHEFPSDLEYSLGYNRSFNEAISSSDYTASNGRLITKWSTGNCMTGSVVA